jgi:dolichol-phosphate mannosyltransferase
MKLAIVMPAYNEAGCIQNVVLSWLRVFDRVDGALVVVNDGSKDQTGRILDQIAAAEPRLRVIHQTNAGHGAAVLRGYREALALQPEYVFQTDSDDQFIPEDFWKLWERKESSRFLLGNRQVRADALHRLVITRIVIYLNFLLFGISVKDANIPFRLMRADYLRELLSLFSPTVFAPNIFLSVLAAKSGSRLGNIPITHQERKTGTVSIIRWKLIKICFRCVKELIIFRLELLKQNKRLRELAAVSA